MTKDIAGFLERIPMIDRCSSVTREDQLPGIYKACLEISKGTGTESIEANSPLS